MNSGRLGLKFWNFKGLGFDPALIINFKNFFGFSDHLYPALFKPDNFVAVFNSGEPVGREGHFLLLLCFQGSDSRPAMLSISKTCCPGSYYCFNTILACNESDYQETCNKDQSFRGVKKISIYQLFYIRHVSGR